MFPSTSTTNLILAFAVFQAVAVPLASNLTIQTSSGTVRGAINETTPDVLTFLGIPYAQPPTGDLRWMPPVATNNTSKVIDGSKFSLNCPQYEGPIRAVDYLDVRESLYQGETGEDCLTLSLWAPAKPANTSVPVFIFIHGGSLQSGGSSVPYQNPSKWIQHTQSHIVVTIQYRLNIFGFPNAAGLSTQNVGYLDQRMAIEWVRDNIASFGGDPSRMILFGQSAGAASTDVQNFAHPDDPIVSGFMSISGSALMPLRSSDWNHSNFTYVARKLNCTTSDPAAELDCMRQVPSEVIVDEVLRQSSIIGLAAFAAIPDEVMYFDNYTQRALDGNVSDRPVVYGTTFGEGISFVDYPKNPDTETPDLKAADNFKVNAFVCPADKLTQLREKNSRRVWRYEYRGNFTNISPRWWIGAWHGSDLPIIFGTAGDARGEATAFERAVSEKMQDMMLAFAMDPHQGLEKLGWSEASSGKGLAFATNANATGLGGNSEGLVSQEVPLTSIDGPCKDWTYGTFHDIPVS